MFTDNVIVSGDLQEVQCVIHPDWMQFSVIEYDFQGESDAIFEHLPSVTYTTASRHHHHAFVGNGVRVNYLAKPTCNNYDLEIELRGKFFVDYDYKPLIDAISSGGGKIRFSRVDAALDYYSTVDYRKPVKLHRVDYSKYDDYDDAWSGFKAGKNDRVVRLYNKAKEQRRDDIVWWRYEIVARGDYCRNVFGHDFAIIDTSSIDYRCADILSQRENVAIYDDQFSSLAARVSNKEISSVPAEPVSYDDAERHLLHTIQRKIDNFVHRFKRTINTDEFYNKLSSFLQINMTGKTPPCLIGGDTPITPLSTTPLSTPVCHTWDELVHEMSIIEKKLQKNNEILMST